MKNQAIQYLGLDVHQATTVVSVRNEHGIVVMRATVRTNADAILGLVQGAGKRVRVAFEEGTQAQWLDDVLQPHAEQVIVCNVRGKSEVANKSDRVDADDLSERLRLGSLKAVYHGAPSVLTRKELVRNDNSLMEDATRVMLRIKALFRARAIPYARNVPQCRGDFDSRASRRHRRRRTRKRRPGSPHSSTLSSARRRCRGRNEQEAGKGEDAGANQAAESAATATADPVPIVTAPRPPHHRHLFAPDRS